MNPRSLFSELLGTAILVFFGVGTATLSFGFKVAGVSTSAGVVATALAFGLVLLLLVDAIGPASGCHVNPAVTIGFLVARRISLTDAVGYWIAQFAGAIAGAAALFGVVHETPKYSTTMIGLGTDGYGTHSTVGLNGTGGVRRRGHPHPRIRIRHPGGHAPCFPLASGADRADLTDAWHVGDEIVEPPSGLMTTLADAPTSVRSMCPLFSASLLLSDGAAVALDGALPRK